MRKSERMSDLTKEMTQMDIIYVVSQCPTMFKECLFLQAKYDVLSSVQATELLLMSRTIFYEMGG